MSPLLKPFLPPFSSLAFRGCKGAGRGLLGSKASNPYCSLDFIELFHVTRFTSSLFIGSVSERSRPRVSRPLLHSTGFRPLPGLAPNHRSRRFPAFSAYGSWY